MAASFKNSQPQLLFSAAALRCAEKLGEPEPDTRTSCGVPLACAAGKNWGKPQQRQARVGSRLARGVSVEGGCVKGGGRESFRPRPHQHMKHALLLLCPLIGWRACAFHVLSVLDRRKSKEGCPANAMPRAWQLLYFERPRFSRRVGLRWNGWASI